MGDFWLGCHRGNYIVEAADVELVSVAPIPRFSGMVGYGNHNRLGSRLNNNEIIGKAVEHESLRTRITRFARKG